MGFFTKRLGNKVVFAGTVTAALLIFNVDIASANPGNVGGNLALWLKADGSVFNAGTNQATDGQAANTWVDASTSGFDAVDGGNTNRPTFVSLGQNFNPTLNFGAGSNDTGFNLGGNFIFSPAANEGYNIFAVVRPAATSLGSRKFVFDFGRYDNANIGLGVSTDDITLSEGAGEENASAATSSGFIAHAKIEFGANKSIEINGNGISSEPTVWTEITAAEIFESATHDSDAGPVSIGRQSKSVNLDSDGGRRFFGDISEIIVYNGKLTLAEITRIQSYLALKYGITLDNDFVPVITNSANINLFQVLFFSGGINFTNSIIGIGRDDAATLDQRVSKSSNDNSILTLSTTDDFFSSNQDTSRTSLDDGQYLVVGHNGQSGVRTDATSNELDLSRYEERIPREWLINNTNSAGEVNLYFEGFDDSWQILVREATFNNATGQDFSLTTGTTATQLSPGGSVAITFPNGASYFTLARVGQDTDGDGVSNKQDVDDDNDGILDTQEGFVAAVTDMDTINGRYNTMFTGSTAEQVNNLASFEMDCGVEPVIATYSLNVESGVLPSFTANNSVTNPTLTVQAGGSGLSSVRFVMYFSQNVDVTFESSGNAASGAITFYTPYTQINAGTGSTIVSTNPDVWHNSNDISFTSFEFDNVNRVEIGLSLPNSLAQIQRLSITNAMGASCTTSGDDSIPNYLDLDSDDDGIADIYEAGNATVRAFDTDGSGHINAMGEGFVDDGTLANSTANNGLDDRIENSIGTAGNGVTPQITNVTADYINLDSDADGIPDAIEARATADHIQYPATIDATADTDNDGILNVYDNNSTFGSTLVGFKANSREPSSDSSETPNDNVPDYLDTDSDGDMATDSSESNALAGVSAADPDGAVTDSASILTLLGNTDGDNSDADFCTLSLPYRIGVDANAGNNDNTSALTDTELNAIAGVSGALPENVFFYRQAIVANDAGTEGTFSTPATPAQIQAMIDEQNGIATSSNAILMQIGLEADNPDNVDSVVTVAEMGTILPAVTNLVPANEGAYQDYIDANPGEFNEPMATQVQVQEMVDTVNAAVIASNAVLAQIGSEADTPDAIDSAVTVDQLNMILPVLTGVAAGSEVAYQNYIDDNPSLFSAPATQPQVQDMITTLANALAVINNAADTDAEDTLTVPDYADAGITGVTIFNLPVLNEAIANIPDEFLPLTVAEIQALLDALPSALENIMNYADDSTNPEPTLNDFNALGVTGVAAMPSGNLDAVNAAIDNLVGADVDSPADVQAVVDAVNNIIDQADGAITAPNTVPVEADFTAIGVTGVTPDNIDAVNAAIAATSDDGTGVDTPAEVQAIVDNIVAVDAALTEVLEDSASPDGNNNGNGVAVTVAQLETITGLENVVPTLEAQYQAEIAATTTFSNLPTVAEVQAAIDAVNEANNTLDTDGDGAPDVAEVIAGTDPVVDGGDADGDGVSDDLETVIDAFGGPANPDATTDTDGDGLPDALEVGIATDLADVNDPTANGANDADDDGITDAVEAYLADNGGSADTTPTTDTDGDGLPDALEIAQGTNHNDMPPLDTDGDGVSDDLEQYIANNGGPADPDATTDTDGDGLPDALEVTTGSIFTDVDSPTTNGSNDADGDGITDAVEEFLSDTGGRTNTSPRTDTDRDGIPDALEIETGSDPFDSDSPVANGGTDGDGDGLTAAQEHLLGTSDTDTDSDSTNTAGTDESGNQIGDAAEDLDGDGISNLTELIMGGDPTDGNDPVLMGAALGATDTDMNNVPDNVQTFLENLGIDPVSTSNDADGDGITDVQEVALGTNPLATGDQDADGDGIPNAIETAIELQTGGMDPDETTDTDGDGITDMFEVSTGTDPIDGTNPNASGTADINDYATALGETVDPSGDSDGDGVLDTDELLAGSNPFGDERPVVWVDTATGTNPDTLELTANLGGYQTPAPTYMWDVASAGLTLDASGGFDGTERTTQISTDSLAEGAYVVSVTVTRPNADPSTVEYVIIVDENGDIQIDDDSDGVSNGNDGKDGLSGDEEVIQVQSGNNTDFLVQADDGIKLRLGVVARAFSNDGIEVTTEQIAMAGDDGSPLMTGTAEDQDFDSSAGIYDYEALNLPNVGDQVKVTIPLIAAIPEFAQLRKFNPASGWSTFDTSNGDAIASAPGTLGTCPAPGDAAYVEGLTTGHFCIQISITDGGANDADGEENGMIIDPVAVSGSTNRNIEAGLRGSSMGPIGIMLLLFTLFAKRRRHVSAWLVLSVLAVASTSAVATEGSWYLGAGAGQSDLEPDLGSSFLTFEDNNDLAWQVFLGKDIKSYLGAEFYYMNLGAADLTADAEAEYQAIGLNALAYWPGNHKTLSAYAKIGLSALDVDGSDVEVDQINSASLSAGVGAQWNISKNFSTRLEWLGIDEDASAVTLNLVKYFGRHDKKGLTPLKEVIVEKIIEPVDSDNDQVIDEFDECPDTSAQQGELINNSGCIVTTDLDKDGVNDQIDLCPNTPQGAKVNSDGCEEKKVIEKAVEKLNYDFKNVNFELASFDLSKESKIILNAAAQVLKKFKTINVEVQAHTDSIGTVKNNQALSKKRAKAVRDYLVQQGVDASRLSSKGYGELRSITTNETAKGRAQNRRVELKVLD